MSVPPPPPNYGPDYGPGYTSFWQDGGTFKAPKFLKQDITINAGNMYVNELDLRVSSAQLDVSDAYVYLSSGRILELRQVNGSIPPNREFRIRLDYYNSIRADRIVLRVSSPQLIGPSSKVQVLLGIAR